MVQRRSRQRGRRKYHPHLQPHAPPQKPQAPESNRCLFMFLASGVAKFNSADTKTPAKDVRDRRPDVNNI